MSFKFPNAIHFKKRTCFKCKKAIDFAEYLVRNKNLNEKKLIKLWENNNLEFYCCLCYDDLTKQNQKEEMFRNLDEKSKEIVKILEKRIKREIPIVSEIKYHENGFVVENNEIAELSLFNCIGEFPEEITILISLKKLCLPWNNLTYLPESICHLSSLKVLDLIGNKLTSVPERLNQLTTLEELDLSFNELQRIPNFLFGLISLKTLNLIHNKLKELPKFVADYKFNKFKILL